MRLVEVDATLSLNDYASDARLALAVAELRAEAHTLVPKIAGCPVWMINSTAQGGGVAEMLPRIISMLRELGVDARWAVLESEEPAFFDLTKRLHNLIHGSGDPVLSSADREVYDRVSRQNADALKPQMGQRDLIVVHDPQPLGTGAILQNELGNRVLFRSHIGLDENLPATQAAWAFLEPYARCVSHAIFSAPEYIPEYLHGRSSTLYPGIDPLSHKNRELTPHKLVGILTNAGLIDASDPVLTPPFDDPAMRLGRDGEFRSLDGAREIGLLFRPTVTQISRWDRLKGWLPLMRGFVELKARYATGGGQSNERHRRRIEIMRLVFAGPDPESVRDDPEGKAVLDEIAAEYRALPEQLQDDIAILSLPMASRKHNALMVNALQRCSTIVVQNSIREGFGLTVTEAMFKGVPVLGSSACGIRHQVRDGVDGMLVDSPSDTTELADKLDTMLSSVLDRSRWGRSGARRAHDEFLVFTQVARWLRVLANETRRSAPPPSR